MNLVSDPYNKLKEPFLTLSSSPKRLLTIDSTQLMFLLIEIKLVSIVAYTENLMFNLRNFR